MNLDGKYLKVYNEDFIVAIDMLLSSGYYEFKFDSVEKTIEYIKQFEMVYIYSDNSKLRWCANIELLENINTKIEIDFRNMIREYKLNRLFNK